MVDYELTSDFDLKFNERKQLASVDGREEFEQDVAVRLHFRLRDATGVLDRTTLREKVNTIVRRTAIEFELLDSINRISIEENPENGETVKLFVEYTSDEIFEEVI